MSSFIASIASVLGLGDQDATVSNFGYSTANTGRNTAIGNDSDNDAHSHQDASAGGLFGSADDSTAVNSAENTNASNGEAVILTGSASAVGNVADTSVAQLSSASPFSDQQASVFNFGYADANTGNNTAVGNNSDNTATSHQDSRAGGLFGSGDDSSAVNSAQNTNLSDGTAVIATGNAQAVGNVADTDIVQGAAMGSGPGIYVGDQDANVFNYGQASANTGGNTAIGNNSTNTATSDQDASAGGLFGSGDDSTAVNSSANTNVSDGTAVIETGDASAVGNVADTDIHQGVDGGDDMDGFDL